MNYIFSNCLFAANGIAHILMRAQAEYQMGLLHDFSSDTSMMTPDDMLEDDCVLFYYPDQPAHFVNALMNTIAVLNRTSIDVVIFASVKPEAIYSILETNIYNKARMRNVLIFMNQSNPNDFYHFVLKLQNKLANHHFCPPRGQNASKKTLSTFELQLLLNYFNNSPFKPHVLQPYSQSTLYRRCRIALSKFASMNSYFEKVIPVRRINKRSLTMNEHAFLLALKQNIISCYFQPIVNEKKVIKGFEILPYWIHHGQLVPPSVFLPMLKSNFVWDTFTSYLLEVAAECIRKFDMKYFFSINLSEHNLASNQSVDYLINTALKLIAPDMRHKLTFEVPETIDLVTNKNYQDTVLRLRSFRFKVFMDDCFSGSSLPLPLRKLRLDGYKIDQELIADFVSNRHDNILLQTMLFYCKLSETPCVAEGVDSRETFELLMSMGVKFFQGHYLSDPISENDLSSRITPQGKLDNKHIP